MQTSALPLFWWAGRALARRWHMGIQAIIPLRFRPQQSTCFVLAAVPWYQVNGSAKHRNDMPYSLVAVRCPDPAMALEFRQSV